MPSPLPPSRLVHLLTLAALLAVAVAARIDIVLLDLNSLLQTFLVDDAFYDFKVAQQVMTLHRITYDGDGPSNGYHPLWMLLITPFYTGSNHGLDYVARVQWIMLAIQGLSVAAMYGAMLRLGASWWLTTCAALLLAVHSTFIDFQFNGLETALNTLVLLWLLHAFARLYTQQQSNRGDFFWFAVAAAAAFLARTDNAIALLLLFGVLLPPCMKQAQGLARLVTSGIVALLLVSPWLIWNQLNFGSIVQTSGQVQTIFTGPQTFDAELLINTLQQTPARILRFTGDIAKWFFYPHGHFTATASAVLLIWFAALCLLLRPAQQNRSLRSAAWFSIAVFLVFCYHAGMRNFVRGWYCIAAAQALFTAYLAALIWLEQQAYRRSAGVMAALWLASVSWLHSPAKLPGHTDRESAHITASNWINANLPADAVIGSMNSGVLSYLTERKVINLDGVMDIRSLQAHWQQRQPSYIHERGITHLVDNAGALQFFCRENPLHTCEPLFSYGIARNPNMVVKIAPKQ